MSAKIRISFAQSIKIVTRLHIFIKKEKRFSPRFVSGHVGASLTDCSSEAFQKSKKKSVKSSAMILELKVFPKRGEILQQKVNCISRMQFR